MYQFDKTRNLAVLVVCALCQGSLWAESSRVIEEVLVTAQKREQSLQDVPASVSSLSGDYLEKTSTHTFSDVAKVTPGLFINDTQDGLGQSVSLRGVGVAPFISNLRPALTFFIDDVPLHRLDSAFKNLLDIERLEVLKGPQSTLYGKEVAAGAIVITTRRPVLGETDGMLSLDVSDPDRRELRGALGVPVTDTVALRFAGYRSRGKGELENIRTGKVRQDDNTGGRLRLLFQPGERLELLVGHDFHKTEVRDAVRERFSYGLFSQPLIGSAITLPADPYDNKTEVAIASGRDISIKNSLLRGVWDMDDSWQLTAILGRQSFDRTLKSGDPVPGGTADVGGDGAFLPVPFLPFHSHGSPDDETSTSAELRFNRSSERWDSLYGVFHHNVDSRESTSVLAGSTALVTARDINNSDWSLYMHHTYTVSERWDLVFGLRYGETEIDQRNLTSFGTGFFGDGRFPLGPEKSDEFDNTSGTLKFVHTVSDDISFYGGVSQGYKPGGFNDAPNAPTFGEEKSVNWELGVKTHLLERTLRLNANVFYQVYDDYQVQEFNPNSPSGLSNILTNAAKVEVPGFELDVLWIAGPNITVDGSLSYIDARYDNYKFASCTDEQKVALIGTSAGSQAGGCTSIEDSTGSAPNGFQDLSGKRLAQNSPWSANVNIQYDDELGGNLAWYVRGEVAFKDDYYGYAALDDYARQPSYTLYNARLALTGDNASWEIALYGKNLTDEEYVGGFFPGRDGPLGAVVIRGAARTLGLSGRYNF